MLENDFFRFPKVKWLHLTGEVNKKCSCQISSGFNVPEIIKIGQFLTELFKKIKSVRFRDSAESSVCVCVTVMSHDVVSATTTVLPSTSLPVTTTTDLHTTSAGVYVTSRDRLYYQHSKADKPAVVEKGESFPRCFP